MANKNAILKYINWAVRRRSSQHRSRKDSSSSTRYSRRRSECSLMLSSAFSIQGRRVKKPKRCQTFTLIPHNRLRKSFRSQIDRRCTIPYPYWKEVTANPEYNRLTAISRWKNAFTGLRVPSIKVVSSRQLIQIVGFSNRLLNIIFYQGNIILTGLKHFFFAFFEGLMKSHFVWEICF